MNKLLTHLKYMQERATLFITPGAYRGVEVEPERTRLFADDMIEALDGFEQREAQADAEFDFVEQCMRTASGTFHGELMPLSELKRRMSNFMQAADELDYAKKLLFYGEDKAKGRVKIEHVSKLGKENCYAAVDRLRVDSFENNPVWAELFLHGVIGAATETGELVEAAYRAIFKGEQLDLVNVKEETGDQKWYLALIAKACGFKWGDDERSVIKKLQKRFPDKFTSEQANNRDLEAERMSLEERTFKAEHVARMSLEEASDLIIPKDDNNA